MRYRVHRFQLRMTRDQDRLEEFLNRLEGEVVTIIPNVVPVPATYVDFVLIVERLFSEKTPVNDELSSIEHSDLAAVEG